VENPGPWTDASVRTAGRRSLSPRSREASAESRQGWPVHRWKAPRAQRTSLFFAEGWEARPSAPGVSAQATHRAQRPTMHVARRAVEGTAGGLARAGRREPASSGPSRGWELVRWDREGIAPSPERAAGAPACRGAGEVCRSLHPAVQRSHDERCPSGSGWGSARSRAPARANAREGTIAGAAHQPRLCRGWRMPSDGTRRIRFGVIRPLTREPRLVAARAAVRGFGLGRRCGGSAARARCRDGVGRGFGCARHGPSVATARRYERASAPSRPSRRRRTERAERASARWPRARIRSGDRTIVRSCSWIELVAEVDERRSVQTARSWV